MPYIRSYFFYILLGKKPLGARYLFTFGDVYAYGKGSGCFIGFTGGIEIREPYYSDGKATLPCGNQDVFE